MLRQKCSFVYLVQEPPFGTSFFSASASNLKDPITSAVFFNVREPPTIVFFYKQNQCISNPMPSLCPLSFLLHKLTEPLVMR